jgi:myosin heavy subunit
MCETWELHLDESVRQMRQRLEELVSGTTFEQIESLLAQIGEKDKLIVQLSSTVHEMRAQVQKVGGAPSSSKESEYQARIAQYRQLLTEKAILYD